MTSHRGYTFVVAPARPLGFPPVWPQATTRAHTETLFGAARVSPMGKVNGKFMLGAVCFGLTGTRILTIAPPNYSTASLIQLAVIG